MPIFKHSDVNILKSNTCVRIVVAIIFRQSNNKAHIRQKCELMLLHCSQCLSEIISSCIMVCSFKNKPVYFTTNFQSLIYICLVLSVCVKYNTCEANMINP